MIATRNGLITGPLTGMNRDDGGALGDTGHLAQSIGDILSTPLGSRVMRRDYGSLLFDLIDAPLNGLTRLQIFAAVATALKRWEPRLRLRRVGLSTGDAQGRVAVTVEGVRIDRPRANELVRLSIPLRPPELRQSNA